MINPSQLLSVAAQLAEPPARGAPQQARLRRAVSTAYYALFHTFIAAATDLLIGASARHSQRYLIVYRSFEHKRMADACRQVLNGTLKTEAGTQFDATIQGSASAFVELQGNRHDADYDPTTKIALSDAQTAVAKARAAVAMLQASPDGERFLFLTFLHFKSRS
jgi:uncharacterized protein (UPF0332 family)